MSRNLRLATGLCICAACLVATVKPALAQTTNGANGSFFAPTTISEIYSKIDLYVKLAFATARIYDPSAPVTPECAGPTAFERRVVKLGERLAEAAYRLYPDLKARIPRFEFSVSDRLEPGVASTARGLIVVLTPLEEISLTDEVLAFAIAREMGHVISRHHEQNTAISIAFSIAMTALAPVLNIGRLFAFASSSASNSMAVNSVSSAASYASSRAVIASYGERQRKAADTVAMQLLPRAGFDMQAVARGIAPVCPQAEPLKWERQFVESIAAIPAPPAVPAEPAQITAASPPAEAQPTQQ